jgi:parallel beta-helix repeat protein
LSAGDTLYIRGGTYAEQLNVSGPGKTGAAGQWLTIAGYPGEKVIIRPAGPMAGYGAVRSRGDIGWVRFDNLDIDGVNLSENEGWIIAYGAHDITINNVRIYNQYYNGLFVDADNITVQNSELRDPRTDCVSGHRYYGIYFHNGANGLIQNNNIHRNAGGGIQVYQDNNGSQKPTRNLTIRNNTIHDNNFCSTSPIGGIIIDKATSGIEISNTQIYNNLIYKNGSLPGHYAGMCDGITVSTTGTGTKIWNNTIYGNDGYGVRVHGSVTDTAVQNNIIYGNTVGNTYLGGINTNADHNVTTNPSFVDVAKADFRLQSGSGAIDAGVTLSIIKADFAGAARPQGLTFDIGAYEVGTRSSLSPPKNLMVK